MTSINGQRLRMLTYLCPDIPLETFFLFRDIVEEATGKETDLIVENRSHGPSHNRTNPFSENLADIVIMRSTDYLKLRKAQQDNMELCPMAPVHTHPLVDNRPVCFSQIIIHAANKEKYKEVKDLKGCAWGYNSECSVSGNLVVLNFLKKTMKTNATYFGSIIQTGSHLNSIKKVFEHSVEAAAVDSTVLSAYLRQHEDHQNKIVCLESLGPLPIYPTLFNSRLSSTLKEKIIEKLQSCGSNPEWKERLSSVGISGFVSVEPELYNLEEDVTESAQGMKMNMTYY